MKYVKGLILILTISCIAVGSGCSWLDDSEADEPDRISTDSNGKIERIEKNFGDTFEFEGLEYTIYNYEFRHFAYKGSYEAANNRVWLIVNAKIKNKSAKKVAFDIADIIVYTEGEQEANFNSYWYNYSEWLKSYSALGPYDEIEGMFMYSIPLSIAPLPTGYDYSYGGKVNGSSDTDLNYELMLKKNSIYATECIVIKL